MDNDKSVENNQRLSAYVDFMTSRTELNSIEEDSDRNIHGKSSDDVDKFEIFNSAFRKLENDANNKALYKSIKVEIKELSSIKFQLLTKGRQRTHDKNLKQEIYWATTEKRADEEMSASSKVEKLSFKDVWEDLLPLKSTKQFCKYLTDSPNLEKPKYLVDAGFFNNIQNTRKKKIKPAPLHDKHTRLFFPRF